jgi:HK97 family phage major capsid protein
MLKKLRLLKKVELLRTQITDIETKLAENETREAALEATIAEAQNDEDLALVDEETEAVAKEKEDLEKEKGTLTEEIENLERELDELNKEPKAAPKAEPDERNKKTMEVTRMNQFKFFRNMNRDQVRELIEKEDVKSFVERTRDLMNQKRAVTGAELTVPVVMLDILRDTIHQYSKLISKVNVRPVKGIARQNIVGAIPEGIWTEACGKLNELDIVFNQIQVDGYKVGGFIAVCNATLKDSDENLADEIMYALAQAIGLALDKAILYGTGAKMPVGIVTRLAEAAQPTYYGDNEKTWTNLKTSNLLLIDPAAATDVEFYKDLVSKLGVVESAYSDGNLFWAMSSKTYRKLQARMLTINASGAIVSGQTKTMPVVGGDIVELDFIPEDVIIGGYGSLYMLAEREGVTLAMSEHVQFIEDNTVFKGIARYDGRPVFGEAFVAINISQEDLEAAPTADAVTFAPDLANA